MFNKFKDNLKEKIKNSSLAQTRIGSEFIRTPDRYGDVHMISFLASTLSRLAYFDDNKFLEKYCKIMGPTIRPAILDGINKVPSTDLGQLLDDAKIFGLDDVSGNEFEDFTYEYQGKKFIDFVKFNMPQNINITNGDTIADRQGIPYDKKNYIEKLMPVPEQVKYISMAWSNYGEIYIVADKRMSNTIFVVFRGTYSPKSAAIYTKPTSLFPLKVCDNSNGRPEEFLFGIFKVTVELIHTIIESITYLATDFLGATSANSVKIFTTGHSLGGAMCSDFAYLWMGIKKTHPYNEAPYNVLADNIICISLGAPRCMSASVAVKFCEFAKEKKILFLRITTRGDPVPALPPKTGFQHPCSDNDEMRKMISEDCNESLQMRTGSPQVNYSKDLDCQNYKTRMYIPNPLSHTIYLYIMYTKAVDIAKFIRGLGPSTEVSRTNGSTVCRLVMGGNNEYKAVFFDVNKAREIPTNTDQELEADVKSDIDQELGADVKSEDPTNTNTNGPTSDLVQVAGGWLDDVSQQAKSRLGNVTEQAKGKIQNISQKVEGSETFQKLKNFKFDITEDVRMTTEIFKDLIANMKILTKSSKSAFQLVNSAKNEGLAPLKGYIHDPFEKSEKKLMPKLSCPGAKFGGRHKQKTKTKKRRNRKTKKNKHRKTKKRTTRKR